MKLSSALGILNEYLWYANPRNKSQSIGCDCIYLPMFQFFPLSWFFERHMSCITHVHSLMLNMLNKVLYQQRIIVHAVVVQSGDW